MVFKRNIMIAKCHEMFVNLNICMKKWCNYCFRGTFYHFDTLTDVN